MKTVRRPRAFRFLIAALAFGCFVPLANAEQVTPSNRVVTRLRARDQPNAKGEVIGYLKPGDKAELVKTTGAWREVKAASWTGFVPVGYTVVIPDEPAEKEAKEYSVRLGSWNVKKLGHGGKKDYAKLASVIDKNFDILAIIEVMQKGGEHPGYEALMNALGAAWTGQVTDTPRPATASGDAEYYAIIWRASTLRPCAGWDGLRHFVDNDGGKDGKGDDLFVREPAFGCYAFGPAEKPAGDFILAAYHATFQGNAKIDAEVGHLGDVFAAMQAAWPEEKDHIIVGDFNRVPSQVAKLLPKFADRTTGSGSTLNGSGNITANLYDHIIVRDPAATAEMQGNATVLDVRSVAGSQTEYFSTMSDHLPIVVVMKAEKDDD